MNRLYFLSWTHDYCIDEFRPGDEADYDNWQYAKLQNVDVKGVTPLFVSPGQNAEKRAKDAVKNRSRIISRDVVKN